PDARQRAEVPHHLLDLRNPNEEFSLAEYMQAAHATAAEIRSRQRTVLFVGGTALYLKSLLRGVTTGPEADWEFRLQLQREIEEHGLPALHARLQLVDPLAAAKLHPNDKRRIIRALEVARKIGQPISHLQTQFDEEIRSQPCRVVTLAWPRPELHGRIERRVEQMFANDLVGEVRRLLADFGTLGRTASQAVGYREVLEHLRGEKSLPETVLAVQARSRQFARRQETWFRSLSECIALPMHPDEEPGKTVERILTEPTLALDRERVS
ncbi:MAG: transferase, partial [Planctomycetota bacterium]